jgi:hypothetical protein
MSVHEHGGRCDRCLARDLTVAWRQERRRNFSINAPAPSSAWLCDPCFALVGRRAS